MAELIDISNEKFWDILFDEACVEGQQAKRIEKALKAISTTEAEIRASAIDEFAEKLPLEISESIIWGMVVTAHRDGNCSETSEEIVDYVIDTAKQVAEQLKEG